MQGMCSDMTHHNGWFHSFFLFAFSRCHPITTQRWSAVYVPISVRMRQEFSLVVVRWYGPEKDRSHALSLPSAPRISYFSSFLLIPYFYCSWILRWSSEILFTSNIFILETKIEVQHVRFFAFLHPRTIPKVSLFSSF